MTEAPIGRLLVAPLHQAIAEVLPERVDFYEHWLHGKGLRGGTIGLAPMTAVLGFLRAEGERYDTVMHLAGRLAAEWSVEGMSPFERRMVSALPRILRTRAALSIARRAVRRGFRPSRASVRLRRGVAQFVVRGSLVCRVRETRAQSPCAYYSALATHLLAQFSIDAHCRVERCRSQGEDDCALTITLRAVDPVAA
jgi:hypothetical protein